MSKLRTASIEDTDPSGISVPAKYITQGSAKAWVRIAVSGGTPSVTKALNVTSLTDGGVGIVTSTFTAAMVDTSFYATTISAAISSNTNNSHYVDSFATSAFRKIWLEGAGPS